MRLACEVATGDAPGGVDSVNEFMLKGRTRWRVVHSKLHLYGKSDTILFGVTSHPVKSYIVKTIIMIVCVQW
jgi:hypothetical protein